MKKVGRDLGIGEKEQKFLKDLAKRAIESVLKKKPLGKIEVISEDLKKPMGVFVTINKKGALRGCIGDIYARKPLYLNVIEMAKASAFEDPRFLPLEESELPEIEIEISVLTPFERIKDVDEIEVGTHGILVKRGLYSGLLLPQVAVEYGWDKETFLDQTCVKAGMSPGCWKDPETEIYIFSAQVF